jgi:membrane protease YdiL (CAAX protease family)
VRERGAGTGPSIDPVTPGDAGRDPTRGIRRLSVLGFLGIVAGYVVVLIVATLFTLDATLSTPGYTETSDVARELVVRMAVPLVFVCVVITALRWWRPVLVDHLPVRRWVWIVPAAIVLTVIAATNYPGLVAKPAPFVALLLLGSLIVGLAEELLFRGVGVTAFRVNGHGEGAVALWTTVIFSLAHAASLLGGPLQVLSTLGAGYLYYLVRRVTGTLLAAALVHGLWDFGVLSAGIVEDEVYGAVPLFLVVEVALLLLLLALHRRIEPARA